MTAITFKATNALQLQLRHFDRVSLTLVGCGGTGSHIASGLPALAQAVAERGQPVQMRFVDPDVVEPKNVGRQLFSRADLGQAKAHVLASRANTAYGLAVGSLVRRVDARDTFRDATPGTFNLVIGAVDNPAGRAVIGKAVAAGLGQVWCIDCGNENYSGQVLIGNAAEARYLKGAVALGMLDRLPSPYLVMPDLVQTPTVIKKPVSCAEATAAGEQGLMVNRMMAAWALAMLHDLLLGTLNYFGVWVNLQTGGVRTWPLDLPTLSEATGLSPKELEHHGK